MAKARVLLGINIDHVATLRQARGTRYPDPVQAALVAEEAGADGITIHPREDRRHIQTRDVYVLKEVLNTRMNLEMAVTEAMLELAEEIEPEHCCLVPEKREEVTTEGGLDILSHMERSRDAVRAFTDAGIPTSMFIDPDEKQLEVSAEIGSPWVELHTGSFARAWYDQSKRAAELEILRKGMEFGISLGLQVNAGHGINYDNVEGAKQLDKVYEFNIGHSIISRSITHGLGEAVQTMRSRLND